MPVYQLRRNSDGTIVNRFSAEDQVQADALAPVGHVAIYLRDDAPVKQSARMEQWRKNARANRRAFRDALHLSPLDPLVYGASHMLEALDAYVAGVRAVDPYAVIVTAMDDVQVFERNHPDMAALATTLLMSEMGLTEGQAQTTLDRIVAAAMLRDRDMNASDAAMQAILTGTEDFL